MSDAGRSFIRDIYDLSKEKEQANKAGDGGFLYNALARILRFDSREGTAVSDSAQKATVLGRVLVEDTLENADISPHLAVLLCKIYSGFVITSLNITNSIEQFSEIGSAVGRVSMDSLHQSKFFDSLVADMEELIATGEVGTVEGLDAYKHADIPASLEKFQVSQYYQLAFNVGEKSKTEVTVPIHVMMLPARLTVEAVTHIVKNGNPEHLFRRLIKTIIGEINPILDFVLCRDLIREQKNSLKQDTNNVLVAYYDDLLTKKRKSFMNIFSGRIQNNLANSILVVDESTLKTVCHSASIDLIEKKADVQKFLDENFILMLAIVDQSHGIVTIHINAIHDPIEIGFERLKAITASKGGVSAEQLIKVLSMGNAPRF